MNATNLVRVTCVAALSGLMLVGCGPSAGSRVRSDVSTVKIERTAERLFERAQAFAEVGDLTRAEQYYSAAIDAGYDDRVALPLLLRVCTQAQRFRVAVEYARDGVNHRPEDMRLRYVLGTLHAVLGDVPSAVEQFEVVLSRHPEDADVHYALAKVLTAANIRLPLADEHYRAYLRLRPDGVHAPEARSSLLVSIP